jgi:hypothetical protein
MPMIGMVGSVTNAPCMIGDQDGTVGDVPHEVIEIPAVAERLMAAARYHC